MAGILAMHAGLLMFGWIYTVFSAVMLVTVGLLLRAQLRVDRHAPPARERDVVPVPGARIASTSSSLGTRP